MTGPDLSDLGPATTIPRMPEQRTKACPVATALVMVAVAVGCGASDDARGHGLSTLRRGTLTVCSDLPYAPFEFEEDGRLLGIDIDLITAVAEDLGVSAEIKDTDTDGIFAALAARQCDVIASAISITEERRRNNEFSQGYFEIQQSLLVRKADADRYKSLDALKGRVVGVQSGTTGEAYARANAVASTIRSYTGVDELLTALKAGQIDGVIQDFPVNAYHARKSGDTAVSVKFPSEPEQYGFVTRKGNVELRDAIDGALSRLKSTSRYTEILRRYLGDTPP